MRRTPKRRRFALRLDVLEERVLLNGDPLGMWPLHDPGPGTSVIARFAGGGPSEADRAILNSLGAYVALSWQDGPSLIALGQGVDRDAALARLKADPDIVYAEPNHRLQAAETIPNDPQFSSQTDLKTTAPGGVDIGAAAAWDITKGSPSTIVAVIDTGIDYTHPDLYLSVAINQGEIPPTLKAQLRDTNGDNLIDFHDLNSPVNAALVHDANGDGHIDVSDLRADSRWMNSLDNDGDGLVNDLFGWNYHDATNNPLDDNGHGTHVSGTIAAQTNNGVGIAGIDWNAKILPLKFLGSDGSGTSADAISAIYYAANHAARVINASWGGDGYDQALADAISYAGSKGAVFVAAAGNAGTNNDTNPFYPAAFHLANEISVAASDSNGNLASFSNYGPNTVGIAAPGVLTLSTVLGGGYGRSSGTSMATPHVSGVVSLLVGLHPEYTARQLVSRILATAKPIPSLAGKIATGGVVNAFAAVNFSTSAPVSLWSDATTPTLAAISQSASVDLGVKFRADVPGTITGLRFYKGAANTGTHVGELWSSSGTLLASATFSGETGSGWQMVQFATPVAIAANTTYIASYWDQSGHFAVDRNYFTTQYDSGVLHAPASGASGGNGVYTYGPAGSFPTSTYLASNYWVDVLFVSGTNSDTTPPTVTSTLPASGATGVPTTTTATATFSEAIDPTTITTSSFLLQDPSNATVPATVSYNAAAHIATLTPSSPLASGATYRTTVKGSASGVKDLAGNAMTADSTWSFTTAASSTNNAISLWSNATTPTTAAIDQSGAVDLGVKFRADVPGTITGIRFYKGAANTGTHIGELWSSNGTLLASATFINEGISGWQTVQFATPVSIAANTTYIASYWDQSGHFAVDHNYFATAYSNGPLHGLADGASGGNGVYTYGPAGSFPTSTYLASNYWVDVLFVSGTNSDTTPPTVTSTLPASGATGVPTTTTATATFSEAIDPTTITTSSFLLQDPSNATVPATVSYNAGSHTATLTPSSPLASGATYRTTVKGSASGVKDLAGNAMTADSTWSFTTIAGSSNPPVSLWSNTVVPTTAAIDQTAAVDLGVKFRADVPGTITGIRFYKGAANTGTHIGELWSSNGTLLASATFINEGISGWQTVQFATPVSIAANTTYIASYWDQSGHFAVDHNYFTTAYSNGPLHALADGASGGNGVYAYGSAGSFPTSTYLASNYWVDVLFVHS